jgi:tetratricopeptide (TPR) repeat protein
MDTPSMRNTAWIRAAPLFLVIFILGAAFQELGLFGDCTFSIIAAGVVVIGYRYLIRYTITRHHVKGLRLVKARRFEEAVRAFEQNLAFFNKHPNLDKWRSLIFLSAARYGYREMTLLNLAYVYGQMGKGARAEQYYQTVLQLNPRNGAAVAALNLLNAKLNDPGLQGPQQAV